MINFLKNLVGVTSYERKLDNILKLEDELEINKSQAVDLANEYKIQMNKHNHDIQANEDNDMIKGKIVEKHGIFMNDYFDRVSALNKERNKIVKSLVKLTKEDDDILKAVEELKKLKGYGNIKKAYKSGKIGFNDYNNIIKAKSGVVSYSDAIVFNDKSEILLLKRVKGGDFEPEKWCLPGGHVDYGESHEQAAIRELEEETYITVDKVKKVGEFSGKGVKIEYFQTRIDETPEITLESEEHSEYAWVKISDLSNYDMIFDAKENLMKIYSPGVDNIVNITKAFVEDLIGIDLYIAVLEKSNAKDDKITKVMREFKNGTLKSGSGKKVTDRKQALAIAISESDKVEKSSDEEDNDSYTEKQLNDLIVEHERVVKVLEPHVKMDEKVKKELEIQKKELKGYRDKLESLKKSSDIEKGGKPAKVGEVRVWADGNSYKKTDKGWVNVESGKTRQEEIKEVKQEWLEEYKKMDLDRLPLGIEKDKITFTPDNPKWVMSWVDPQTGKSMRSYRNDFLKKNAKVKWDRIKNITPETINSVRNKSIELLNSKDKKEQEIGAIVTIIANTGLRIGSRNGFKETENRGVSTLSADNVKINGDKVSFEFVGKSYKNNTAEIENKKLAEVLGELKKNRSDETFLFNVNETNVRDTFKDKINSGLKIKDLRTYVATEMARKILKNDKTAPPPLSGDNKKDKKAIQVKLSNLFKEVSNKLNNTPTMAKSSYVLPDVYESWIDSINARGVVNKKSSDDEINKAESDKITDEDYDDVEEYPLPEWWDHDLIEK